MWTHLRINLDVLGPTYDRILLCGSARVQLPQQPRPTARIDLPVFLLKEAAIDFIDEEGDEILKKASLKDVSGGLLANLLTAA